MVAIIKTGSSIHRIINYNEQKIKEGKAECITASNYPKDVVYLTINNKINRLLNQGRSGDALNARSHYLRVPHST